MPWDLDVTGKCDSHRVRNKMLLRRSGECDRFEECGTGGLENASAQPPASTESVLGSVRKRARVQTDASG